MDGESRTPGMIAPALSLGHISFFLHAKMGSCFITVGMVLLLYEEGETRKVWLHHWLFAPVVVVGWCGVAILGLSISSLLFYHHVFYSTHPRVMFCMLCTPALVRYCLGGFFFFLLLLHSTLEAGTSTWLGTTDNFKRRSVGRRDCIERDGGTGDSGEFLVYIHCIVQ